MATDGAAPRRTAFSAGGVVYRIAEQGIEIVLCGRMSSGLWALPKGSPEPGESAAETALREVREETGLNVAIDGQIGLVEYRFVGPDRTEYDKTVEHHLMRPIGGSLEQHDGEFDDVRWVPVNAALSMMRYENERDIVRRAVQLIQDRAEA